MPPEESLMMQRHSLHWQSLMIDMISSHKLRQNFSLQKLILLRRVYVAVPAEAPILPSDPKGPFNGSVEHIFLEESESADLGVWSIRIMRSWYDNRCDYWYFHTHSYNYVIPSTMYSCHEHSYTVAIFKPAWRDHPCHKLCKWIESVWSK